MTTYRLTDAVDPAEIANANQPMLAFVLADEDDGENVHLKIFIVEDAATVQLRNRDLATATAVVSYMSTYGWRLAARYDMTLMFTRAN